MPKELIADLSIQSNCRAMLVFDRMNTYKQLVDRQVLTSKHYSPDEQPQQLVALFTLAGVNSIVINNWSQTPEASIKQYECILRSMLTDGTYLGTTGLQKHYKIAE